MLVVLKERIVCIEGYVRCNFDFFSNIDIYIRCD